jgi:hypothetical protein
MDALLSAKFFQFLNLIVEIIIAQTFDITPENGTVPDKNEIRLEVDKIVH